jgi:hypothetical protein
VFVRGVLTVFAVLTMFFFVMLVLGGMFVLDMDGIAKRGGVFGGFVSGVCFEFGAIGGAVLFDLGSFGFGEFRFGSGLVFRCVEPGFLLSFFFVFFFRKFGIEGGLNILDFFFVEFGAAYESVDLGVVGSLFVLGFGEFVSDGRGLVLA